MKESSSLSGLEFENWQILGQEHVVTYLKSALSSDTLFQSLLLVGNEHLGKRTLALRLAMAASCKSQEAKPCFKCKACLEVSNGSHQNLYHIDDDRISISKIRELKKKLAYKQNNKFFCLIDGYESLSIEAEHALLKILEEPNPNVHFVILAKNQGAVLKTVISRSLVLKLNPVSDQVVENFFASLKITVDKDTLDFIAGRPGLA
ncbi:MAG: hypothetical protein ACFFG0_10780, partial [Candidatus Thorarchaeota archaeon]